MSTAIKSKWLFVGTEKGNTHVLNLDHFSLSGYIINWNKAIGVHQSSHPGPVSYLLGEMRLRIFESGPSHWPLYSVFVRTFCKMNAKSQVLSQYHRKSARRPTYVELQTSFNVFDLVYPAENPADPSKLLIGFESGFLSLWDLGTKKQEEHYR